MLKCKTNSWTRNFYHNLTNSSAKPCRHRRAAPHPCGRRFGKTRDRASHRVSRRRKKIPTWNILAVTFTNKAADEMRQRVQRLLHARNDSSLPLVSTFHSLCVRILRQDIEKLNDSYTRRFTIYDQDDSLRVVRQSVKELGYDEKSLGQRAVQSAISSAKNRGEDTRAFAARAEYGDERRAAIARVYEMYENRLHANNALDFDDLLIKTVRLCARRPGSARESNNKFRYILVDEYQDTNSLQFDLIRFITQKQQNICVVGDEDQSIYKWRGADISNILNFEVHFPRTKIIRLEQNYRSTQTILDIAGAVVKNNRQRKGKNLWTSNPRGGPVGYYQVYEGEAAGSPARSSNIAAMSLTFAPRCFIARTLNRACLKKRCVAPHSSTTFSAALVFTSEWKYATSSL